MNPQFSAHGLGLWRGGRRLCQGLSFSLEPGEALQLRGANGSGKTSLLRVLAGLGRVDEGEVRWAGELIRGSADHRASLLYLAHANGLKAHLSPRENYIFYQSITDNSSEITADEALVRFGLIDVSDRPCAYLSMGQKRRAALARLLATRSRLWLLDEPLTSLDAAGADLVADLLKAHLKQKGLVVLATHQPLPGKGIPLRSLELGAAP
ncbi:MAG TPA: cytochrome c biogenesis heme-transporting ATPase CcmA [Gammaproteobacteria bacterium]|jgi:heme exporter protein A|nr:cytochrome c biogenesis heme-transporting ATPase CcmA [Gammaproteobacteria bacterium]